MRDSISSPLLAKIKTTVIVNFPSIRAEASVKGGPVQDGEAEDT